MEMLQHDSNAVQYYTGFDDFEHLFFFFQCLGQAANNLKYQSSLMSPQEQLFVTLMKLRQAQDNKAIAILYNISENTVSKIFRTWVNFMYFQLKEIDTWPSNDNVKEYLPGFA
uniref:Transposase Helix-turn-helix domain-containing protein n=1 Tax=Ciona intestinalis TaxID=7719 RepID=H2XTS7_CIOIN